MKLPTQKYLNPIVLVGLFILITILLASKLPYPKVFVIGDSISIQYGPYLKKYLEEFAGYDRKRDNGEAMTNLDKPVGANGGDSRRVVQYLKSLAKDTAIDSDILLLNCGLHDIKVNKKTMKKQVEKVEYLTNLKEILRLTEKMNLKLIWVSSTAVNDKIHNAKNLDFLRFDKDIVIYNSLADSLFMVNRVPVVDLYSFTKKFGKTAYNDHVHYKNEICDAQAKYISEQIKQILKNELQ